MVLEEVASKVMVPADMFSPAVLFQEPETVRVVSASIWSLPLFLMVTSPTEVSVTEEEIRVSVPEAVEILLLSIINSPFPAPSLASSR